MSNGTVDATGTKHANKIRHVTLVRQQDVIASPGGLLSSIANNANATWNNGVRSHRVITTIGQITRQVEWSTPMANAYGLSNRSRGQVTATTRQRGHEGRRWCSRRRLAHMTVVYCWQAQQENATNNGNRLEQQK